MHSSERLQGCVSHETKDESSNDGRHLLPAWRLNFIPHFVSHVEVVGVEWTCAICYGIIIPAFLLYLIVKQRLVLAPSRCLTTYAEKTDGKIVIRVKSVCQKASLSSEDGFTPHVPAWKKYD